MKTVVQEEEPVVDPKDFAKKLLAVMDKPRTKESLMARAEIAEEYADIVLLVLRKLREADMVVSKRYTEDGPIKWSLVE